MLLCVCTSIDCKVIRSYPRWWDDFKHHLALRTNHEGVHYVIFTVLCLVFSSWMKIFLSEHCYQTLLISIESVHKKSLQISQLMHNFSCMFISILYMFRAAVCPSSGELLYQCYTWFMSLRKEHIFFVSVVSCGAFHTTETKKIYSFRSDIKQVLHWYNSSPDDGHTAAQNMKRIEINIHEKLGI